MQLALAGLGNCAPFDLFVAGGAGDKQPDKNKSEMTSNEDNINKLYFCINTT
jgi:hypothetical protein